MTNIINLTPHDVVFLDSSDSIVATFPKADTPARLATTTVADGFLGDFPMTKTSFGKPLNLPNFKDGTFYIVSRIFLAALPNRTDLLVPNELVRDDKGVPIGCRSFAKS